MGQGYFKGHRLQVFHSTQYFLKSLAKNLLIRQNYSMTQIQGDGFNVAIIRSKRRKTLALAVANGEVIVRMPAKMAAHHAERFIQQKTAWIQQKLAAHPAARKKEFADGEAYLFLGQQLLLKINSNRLSNTVSVNHQTLQLALKNKAPSQALISKHLTAWYKQQATQHLISRCRELSAQTGLYPREIIVKTYKARWGSCTRSGDIQFNWKLIMAPEAVIDYVIIHELCHLKQHNHSPAFWQLVENFCIHYQVHRAWLKTNGHQLSLDHA